MRVLQHFSSSRNRQAVVVVLALGVILASVIYREEIQSTASHVTTFSFPIKTKTRPDATVTAISSNLSATESSSTEKSAAIPTSIHPPEPLATIENNHASYPRLAPLDMRGLDSLRERHLQRIEDVISGNIPDYREWNVVQLDGLKDHWLEVGANGRFEQPKVILSTYGCSTTGEVIWLESLMNAFREQKQFFLYASYENIGKMYKSLDDIVTHVWSTDEHVIWCFNDTISCVESPENPHGIPSWKIFTFTFWGSPQGWGNFMAPREPWSYNPLGGEWNLIPYVMPDKQFYLGYHYTGCTNLPYVPSGERKNQIAILAKRSEYFYKDTFLQPEIWPILKNLTGLDLISVSNSEEGFPVRDALTLLGPMERHDYDMMLVRGSSKALLGIGRPKISPSPYASLCRGVPVIIPYNGKICPARVEESEWCGNHHQHGPASRIGPPYVYTIDSQGPIEDIVGTIMTAVNTPIEPYVPPDMTEEALKRRIDDYFSIDWKAYAMERMQEKGWERVVTQEFMYRWLAKHPVRKQRDKRSPL
ncbi:hypothetical protein VNI00_009675 [Paramarasmius palmivorus]|uniref:Alpha-1,6-mannosyl-glycoprotein 6-beta-N-acetylglucosaminyltransferase n=1 Tax=Paramarasmius palmivorus TaxID=297713 RepID=A0AAW0CP48_9AGAR